MTVDLDHLRTLEQAATALPLELDRYEHGGGRLAKFSPDRILVADFYNEGDRELFVALRNAAPDLFDELDGLRNEVEQPDLTTCPYFLGTGDKVCTFGCHDEPSCMTDMPREGWPMLSHPLVVMLTAERDRLRAEVERLREWVETAVCGECGCHSSVGVPRLAAATPTEGETDDPR